MLEAVQIIEIIWIIQTADTITTDTIVIDTIISGMKVASQSSRIQTKNIEIRTNHRCRLVDWWNLFYDQFEA